MSEMSEMNDYQVYLDMVKEYLVAKKKRLLTEKEEEIVTAQLHVTALSFTNGHKSYEGLGITQVLAIETAKKVSELHPDFPMPTEEQIKQRVEEVLAVQNFLS